MKTGNLYGSPRTITIILLIMLSSLAMLYLYYGSIGPQEIATQSTSPVAGAPSETYSTSPKVHVVDFFSKFYSNITKFYTDHQDMGHVSVTDSFCQALLLGKLVNSTHILINGTLYRYGILAYKPMNGSYVIFDKLDLDDKIHIVHIQPRENITVTGGFGRTIWFELSVNSENKVYWSTEYPGIVYEKEKLICTHNTIKVNDETIHIVRLFFIKHGVEGGVRVTSTWLALVLTENY
ncbi:hypothetical protein DRH29_05710 [candidate division Kazan bacterium]|uniref:Uncharacterized protein n=1 Tax=candidate division Kazan bacterium TaxID=2202143 RepID=A0A420ZB06_UNCK3|nr:MAG: hypothetical protein DRH29_05710 [candidate division Kazan bacterium]